ncbi:MAG: membrane protein insertion efficiency factor YidD [Ilumatobacteraceae bacterium]|nr:membrane protein insertion efficiency factor YidD [Ilumatobacteraceae bacterium]
MSGSVWQRRMLRAIEWYQKAFQWRPSPCRFSPTCSHYSHEAISLHGPRKGLWLTVKRLLRCRPFGPSGFDPVPEVDHAIVTYHEPMRTP